MKGSNVVFDAVKVVLLLMLCVIIVPTTMMIMHSTLTGGTPNVVAGEQSNFDADRVISSDNKNAYFVITTEDGKTINVKSTDGITYTYPSPVIGDKNYIKYKTYAEDSGLYSKGDMVVEEFMVDLETAKKMGMTNNDIVVQNNSSEGLLRGLIWVTALRNLMEIL